MYAIVEIAGQQFKVEKDQEIFVHRLEGEAGSAVAFDNVMLLDNDGKVTIGTPTIDGAQVKAKIIEHLKGDKVIVFHKKRRKGYQKQNGHRQYLSKLVIEDLIATGATKVEKKEKVKPAPKAEKKVAKPKAAPKKAVAAKVEKPEAAPKAEAKKVAKPKAPAKPKAEKKETVAKKAVKAAPKAEAKKVAKPKAPAKPKAEKKAEPKAKEKKEDTK
jgi:large subunit ribosomal protein L21